MTSWLAELAGLLGNGRPVVRVVVAATRGSTPREAGATMLVHAGGAAGSIGGGNLELAAIQRARRTLADGDPRNGHQRYTLGPELAQCCGGVADIWWEYHAPDGVRAVQNARRRLEAGEALTWLSLPRGWTVTGPREGPVATSALSRREVIELTQSLPADTAAMLCEHAGASLLVQRLTRDLTPLWLYGGGHVGQAIVRALAELPFAVTWIDSRPEIFPREVPANACRSFAANPAATVRMVPPEAWFLVLTHSHRQDLAICHEILSRETHRFTGLIGSRAKAVRFARRLAGAGIPPQRLDRLICPIGVPGIRGKAPATIAIAVAAQLLQERERLAAGERPLTGTLSRIVTGEPA